MTGDIARYQGPQIRSTTGVVFDPVPPRSPRVSCWAAARSVRGLAFDPATRTVWAATAGGVLGVNWGTRIARWHTAAHAVPAAAAVAVVGGVVVVGRTDGGVGRFTDGQWEPDHHWEKLPPVRALADGGGGVAAVAGRSAVWQPAGGGVEAVVADHPLLSDARSVVCDGPVWWVATPRGVVRLTRGSPPVLCDDTPCHQLALADGVLWAATTAGLKRIQDEAVETHRPPHPEPANVTTVAAGPGVVWAAAGGRCWAVRDGHWEGAGRRLERLIADPTRPDVWASGPDGLTHLRFVGGVLRASEPFAAEPLQPSSVGHLAFADRVYLGGTNGLWLLGDSAVRATADGVGVYALVAVGGACWAVVRPGGLVRLSAAGVVTVGVEGIPLAVAADRTTAFALTSRRLYRCSPAGEPEAVGRGWAEPPVCLVVSDAGACRLGTARGVLALTPDGRWEDDTGRDAHRPTRVRGLAFDGDHLWAATPAGVWCRSPAGWRLVVADRDCLAVGRAAAGGVWAVARGWLARCTHTGHVLPLADPAVAALGGATAVAEHRAAVWVAAASGVVRFTLPSAGETA